MTTVLKLGGSVVTEKDEPETVDEVNLGRAAAALPGTDDLVVVHGGGSFGHHHASEHRVTTTEGTREAVGVTDIHGAMKRLNDAVVATLQREGVPAVPVHPFSIARRNADGGLHLPADSVRAMLEEGFVPALHGDVVVHAGRGATILSGDELVVSLAESLGADRVGLCSDVPGVLDDSGAVVPHIDRFADVADYLGGSEATDVTGGMATKVRELLALGAPAHVFDMDGLAAFVAGESPGTRIEGTDGGE